MSAFLGLWPARILTSTSGTMGIQGNVRNVTSVTRSLGRAGAGAADQSGRRHTPELGTCKARSSASPFARRFDRPVLRGGTQCALGEPRTYTAESPMVDQLGRNPATLLIPSDHPDDPTLRAGCNAVMTVTERGHVSLMNACPGLSCWEANTVFSRAPSLPGTARWALREGHLERCQADSYTRQGLLSTPCCGR
ncbi:hypothetical protein [Deinococcus hopiensis]|uniref:Uncharacterized protein n=1 Tax=Deinococcus hopiensis KR-140 TaxID=695939 RepID=A0A1W1VLL1_9DEIO|nr:hypothetical protein [Deinococcus hopiensis]SMB93834.1 hypothetical protein SAMN00790413_02134 [Deinococcus hopiensis KR-140]